MLNFVFNKTEFEESHQSYYMGYREEAIECVSILKYSNKMNYKSLKLEHQ